MNVVPDSIWTGDRDSVAVAVRVSRMRAAIRRNALSLLAWIAVCDLAGFAYAKLVRPEYVATAQVLLQSRHIANEGPEDLRHYHQFAIDSELCETELRVIRSERLLSGVFDKLGLAETPEMTGGADGLWAGLARTLHRWLPGFLPFSEDLRAYYTFADRVRSRRIGLSYVIDISYRAHSGERAARVANAVASAYVAGRIQGALARAREQTPYLKDSLDALAAQLGTADLALRRGTVPDVELPAADVRVLGPATVPLKPSYPKTVPILIWSTGLGLVSGLLILLFRHRTARAGRTARATDPGLVTA